MEKERTIHLSHWEPIRDQEPNESDFLEWNQMMREERSREQLEAYERNETYGD
jgi:hypothetical protein